MNDTSLSEAILAIRFATAMDDPFEAIDFLRDWQDGTAAISEEWSAWQKFLAASRGRAAHG